MKLVTEIHRRWPGNLVILLVFWAGWFGLLPAQVAEIPFHTEPYYLDSGVHNGPAGGPAIRVYSAVIEVEGAPWLRLFFSEAHLGRGSYLLITSRQDGAWQRLDAVTLREWQNSTAYFNGDAVTLELYVAEGDQGVFVRMQEIMVGEWVQGPPLESICGPTDDRIPSNDPAVGRLLNIGCTGWIITNGKLISAGHCLDGNGANVMEFNVPPSLPNGTIQHPLPEDQYAVDVSSKVYVNGGVGNDWGVFNVFDNSITGLQPIQAQGAAFLVVQDLTPDSIRITGYGVDDGTANQTQQTHVGPNAGSSGTVMRYRTDTQGGNSGSPVIDDATHFAVGVHTHGGCTATGGANQGTSAFHPQFWAAIGQQGVFPSPPDSFVAYSDYRTPTSMLLSWIDPSTLINGDTLQPGTFQIMIERDGVLIDSVAGGVESYVDTGLVDGTEYTYSIFTRRDTLGLISTSVQATWIAGGSPIPSPPIQFSVAGNQQQVTLSWINPRENIDGTPMDDFAGINLYQNGALVATFTRSSADTGLADTATYVPSTPGFYDWYITAIDNETPQNESDPSTILGTPLALPIIDEFTTAGPPNPGVWINTHAGVNDRAQNPPSPPYALNLNGTPAGSDTVDLKAIDLTGLEGANVRFSFAYQPQGNGNAPEEGDSLLVYFRNNLGEWVQVAGYPGQSVQPFVTEEIALDSISAGGGSFFHGQFQVRFRSIGGASNIANDDWFVDNVRLETPVGIGQPRQGEMVREYAISANYPNPFNPTTTIAYELPQRSTVRLVIYDLLGQQVRELLNQPKEAGRYRVVWDGRDDQGQAVASGMYIYRFEATPISGKAPRFIRTRKMVLLK